MLLDGRTSTLAMHYCTVNIVMDRFQSPRTFAQNVNPDRRRPKNAIIIRQRHEHECAANLVGAYTAMSTIAPLSNKV